jgi:hypothetical protein
VTRPRPAFYVLVAAASLAVSFLVVLRQPITNPDGALYMEAAQYFAAGDWASARSVYPWPLYPWLISLVLRLGVEAYTAAQIVNALFDASIALLFLDIVRRLPGADRVLAYVSAGLILLSPQLMQIRALLVRDHGFLTFYLLVLDLLVWDFAVPSRRKKIGLAAAIVAAGLFRIEAFFLFVLVPGFYLYSKLSKERQRLTVVLCCLGACALLPVAYYFKYGLVQVAFDLVRYGRLPSLVNFFDTVAVHISILREWAPGSAWHAYLGMVLGVMVLGTIRHGIGIPLFLLSLAAFTPPVRERYGLVARLVAWFATGQAMVVLAYLFVSLLMDFRFVLNVSLLATLATACVLRELIHAWPRLPGRSLTARWALPAATVALLVSVAVSVPRNPPLYLREAGEWIDKHVSPAETVLTNDVRILHYAGRLQLDNPSSVQPYPSVAVPAVDWVKHSFLIVDVLQGSGLEQKILNHFRRPPDATIGDGPSRVLVFRTNKFERP